MLAHQLPAVDGYIILRCRVYAMLRAPGHELARVGVVRPQSLRGCVPVRRVQYQESKSSRCLLLPGRRPAVVRVLWSCPSSCMITFYRVQYAWRGGQMGGRAQFEQYYQDNGLGINIIELDKSTRTAQLAAEALEKL